MSAHGAAGGRIGEGRRAIRTDDRYRGGASSSGRRGGARGVSETKARTARSPLRGRGRSQRVTVPQVARQELERGLRRAAAGGATAELEEALAAALWLSPADLVAVGALGAILRSLEPGIPVGLVPPTGEERERLERSPRVYDREAVKVLMPQALELIRSLGLTPQARAALGIELVPGPAPEATARGAGYAEPSPIRRPAARKP
jgi:hypothetical protein